MFAKFFAPEKVYPPCGMFTKGHFILLSVCILLLVISILLTYKKNDAFLNRLVKITGPILVILEIIKITYKFHYGYTYLDAWVPISYCSIFMFSLLLSGYGKGILKKIGNAFITLGCATAGAGFLLIPSTSLMIMPAFHFLSFHSMFYHSVMVFMGLSFIIHKTAKFNFINYLYFILIFAVFATASITMNYVFGCNLMTLRDPSYLPFNFLQVMQAKSQISYIAFISLFYLTMPFLSSYLIHKIIIYREIKKKNVQYVKI